MFWEPMWGILLAVGLSLLIGVEREFYAKSAGMRTYALVGLGSALFTVVSKYGFVDVAMDEFSRYDGSRVAAQVVSGIGFLGAGLIFVRRDAVRGLTTAAGVWFVAAVGMAAGAGLYLIAGAVTALYLLVMVGIRPLQQRMPQARSTLAVYRIRYHDGRGVLRDVMEAISKVGLKVADLRTLGQVEGQADLRLQEVRVEVEGSANSIANLDHDLLDVAGVESVEKDSQANRFRGED